VQRQQALSLDSTDDEATAQINPNDGGASLAELSALPIESLKAKLAPLKGFKAVSKYDRILLEGLFAASKNSTATKR